MEKHTETNEMRNIVELCDEAIRLSEQLQADIKASEAVMADE